MKKKLRRKDGLTLTELLCVLVIVVLIGAVIATGVSLGLRTYERSVTYSEAQTLCSTLRTAISDELRYAGTVSVAEDGSVRYFSRSYGQNASLYADGQSGQLTVETPDNLSAPVHKLLPSRTYPYGLRAALTIGYSEPEGIFHVTLQVLSRQGESLSETEFDVERLNKSTIGAGN